MSLYHYEICQFTCNRLPLSCVALICPGINYPIMYTTLDIKLMQLDLMGLVSYML